MAYDDPARHAQSYEQATAAANEVLRSEEHAAFPSQGSGHGADLWPAGYWSTGRFLEQQKRQPSRVLAIVGHEVFSPAFYKVNIIYIMGLESCRASAGWGTRSDKGHGAASRFVNTKLAFGITDVIISDSSVLQNKGSRHWDGLLEKSL